jgi:Secretion system C-terminal sorting domain
LICLIRGCMGAPADLCGQEFVTFSKLINDSLPIIFKNVIVQESSYFVSAQSADIDSAFFYNLSAYVFDLNGDVIDLKRYGNPLQSLFTMDMSTEQTNGTIISVTTDLSKNIPTACLIWLTPIGDTIQCRNYISPIYNSGDVQTGWFVPQDITSDADNNIYLVSQIFNEEFGNDYTVMKLTPYGEILWTFVSTQSSRYNGCAAIRINESGIFCPAGSFDPTDLLIGGQEQFIELDFDGNIIREGTDITSHLMQRPIDFVLENDGIVAVTTIREDLYHDNTIVYRADDSDNVIWFHNFDIPYSSYPKKIVKTCDDGYIMSGFHAEINTPSDSIDGQNNENLMLMKFSHEGVHEWTRYYHIISGLQDRHTMYDMKATPDRGVILAGYASNEIQNPPIEDLPYQKGWLLKLDPCGCLVPGCDLDCDANACDASTPMFGDQIFIAGPNPVSDLLNIFISKNAPPTGIFSMFDAAGNKVADFNYLANDTTYVWDVSPYADGQYTLTLTSGDRIYQTMKIIIVNAR